MTLCTRGFDALYCSYHLDGGDAMHVTEHSHAPADSARPGPAGVAVVRLPHALLLLLALLLLP